MIRARDGGGDARTRCRASDRAVNAPAAVEDHVGTRDSATLMELCPATNGPNGECRHRPPQPAAARSHIRLRCPRGRTLRPVSPRGPRCAAAAEGGHPSADCPPVLVLTLMMLVVVYFSVSIFLSTPPRGYEFGTRGLFTRAGPKTLNPTPGKLDKRPGKAEDFGQKGNTVSQVIIHTRPAEELNTSCILLLLRCVSE